MIPVFKPCFGEDEINALREPFETGWIGLGPKTVAFEEAFAAYIGVNHAAALNSCTAALHLAFEIVDVKDAEVITTPMTFVSTNHAILYGGGTPVFCDIEEDTLSIDADKIEALITPKTKAVVIVHFGGAPCDMDKIVDICKRHNLALIEDCAHACGGSYKGKKLGTFGDIGCFSFQAVKNLAVGDGGMLVCNDPIIDTKTRSLRWVGINKDTWSREETDSKRYSWFYSVDALGYKYHMNDIAAAIGLVQLAKLETMNGRRRDICRRYAEAFAAVDGLGLPRYRTGIEESACHNFVIRTKKRDWLNSELKQRGISTGVHYIPNNHYDMYKPFGAPTPVSDAVWQELLTLPVYPDLTDEQLEYVVAAVVELMKA
jgi:perosamine synthetase